MMESLTNELKLIKSDVITTTVCSYFIANCPDKSKARILRYDLIKIYQLHQIYFIELMNLNN